jgi:hypothetical protein
MDKRRRMNILKEGAYGSAKGSTNFIQRNKTMPTVASSKEPESPTQSAQTPIAVEKPEKKLLPYEYLEPNESAELMEVYAFRKFVYGGVGVVHDHVTQFPFRGHD